MTAWAMLKLAFVLVRNKVGTFENYRAFTQDVFTTQSITGGTIPTHFPKCFEGDKELTLFNVLTLFKFSLRN